MAQISEMLKKIKALFPLVHWLKKSDYSSLEFSIFLAFSSFWAFTLVSIKRIVSFTFLQYFNLKVEYKGVSFIFPFLLVWLWRAYRDAWALYASVGRWTLDAGHWTMYSGRWTLDSGLSMLDVGCYTLDARLWALDTIFDSFRTKSKAISDSAWLNYWKYFGCESLRISWSRLLYRDYRFWLDYF